jgi:NAD(P)H-hydrate epimerase
MSLPIAIYSVEQVRAMDAHATNVVGIPGYALMTRAAQAALRALRQRWPQAHRVLIVCGSGNNGGDGYVLARLARQAQLEVTVSALAAPQNLKGDARTAWQDFVRDGGTVTMWSGSLAQFDVIVDAIFGTGLSRSLDTETRNCVNALNESGIPIVALDIPSGLHGDTGRVLGAAIKAQCTITFVGLKLGLFAGVAPDYVGELVFDDLAVPAAAAFAACANRIAEEWLAKVLPRRSRLAHKGVNGHVLVVGGNHGMAGAVRLTGEACMRVGAGLVSIATRSENVAAIVSERSELMVHGVESADQLKRLVEKADVIAIGPGLGQDEWSAAMLSAVLDCAKPVVVDADALNLLARSPGARANWILTPHPGEAGRLLQTSSAEVQDDRMAAVGALAQRFGGVAVLKGARTLVATATDLPAICDRGNPAMGTGGMGDVLTGVIAGLRAQMTNDFDAARAGVLVHALAGDAATARLGAHVDRGLIASDLFAYLPACASPRD